MRLPVVACSVFGLLALAPAADAFETGRFRFVPGGDIQAVRAADLTGDGRPDLVVLLTDETEGRAPRQELLVLETPASPVAGTFYPPEAVRRIPLDEGAAADAGALAIGRFGAGGSWRLRFLGPHGVRDVTPDGQAPPSEARLDVPTLFARSAGRPLVLWDGHADLDGDGIEECWFPEAAGNGAIHVLGGTPAGDRVLALEADNLAASDESALLVREAQVPVLQAADLDGDGKRELVGYRGGRLVAWSPLAGGTDAPVPAAFELSLPFVRTQLGPDEIYTPRLQLADVDANGCADLLVTIVTGTRTEVESLRTLFLYFPGPIRDVASGALVPPRARIDTESVALHPHFVDVDGDGALDYVSDSIRGTKRDLLLRAIGQEPTIWHVGYRFLRAEGTFEKMPAFSLERPYARSEAVSNRLRRSASFAGDFDADGMKDALDLGNLKGIELLAGRRKTGGGSGDAIAFQEALVPLVRMPETLEADAVVADLTGDGRADAVVWSRKTLFLVVPEGDR